MACVTSCLDEENAAAQRELLAFTRLCCFVKLPRASLLGYADRAVECELCTPMDVLLENEQAYVQFERDSLSPGHVIVVPRRHVADFFQMSTGEHDA